MKKIVMVFGVIVLLLISVVGIICLIRGKNMNYKEFIDEKCGFEVSQYLEYDRGSVGMSESRFSLQFKVIKGCEEELENVLNNKYQDLIEIDDTVRIGNSSMSQMIKKGTKHHIYVFFRSGKNKKTVEINICIVDIKGQQYVFFYTV